MLTEARWLKEQELMRSVFPQFMPFMRRSSFGFEGHLKGSRSGQRYRVVLEADQRSYPQCPPNIHMEPRIGHHWLGDRRANLCVIKTWYAARSTFANTLLAAVKYLEEHDGVPEESEEAARNQARLFW